MGIKFNVPFTPMNPNYTDKTLEELFELYEGEMYVEIKSDGNRSLEHVNGSDVTFFTRQMKEFEARCFPELVESWAKLNLVKSVFDSELAGTAEKKQGFDQFGKRKRYAGISEKALRDYFKEDLIGQYPIETVVFDTLMYKGKPVFNKPLRERRKMTEGVQSDFIRPSKLWVCRSVAEVQHLYDEFVEKQNYEGLVLKNPKSPHRLGVTTSDDWVKWKKFEPIDMAVVGFYKDDVSYGQDLPITGILVAVLNGDHYETLGKVNAARKDESTGRYFSELIYDQLHGKELSSPTSNLSVSPNMEKMGKEPLCYFDPSSSIVVEVKAMNIGRGENANSCGYDGTKAYSLRIAYLNRIRDDKDTSMTSTKDLVDKLYRKTQM